MKVRSGFSTALKFLDNDQNQKETQPDRTESLLRPSK